MKKNILLILAFFTFIQFFTVSNVFAQGTIEYKVLAPLPGLYSQGDCSTGGSTDCKYVVTVQGDSSSTDTLATFLNTAYNYIVGLSIVLAVVMIIYGGVQYATSDAATKKSAGKNTIKNAVLGLLLVLCSFLILNTINPDLTKFNLNMNTLPATNESAGTTNPNTGGTGGTGGGQPKPQVQTSWTDAMAAEVLASADERALLAYPGGNGIEIKSNTCTTRLYEQFKTNGRPNCTEVGGMPVSTINNLIQLEKDCKAYNTRCEVFITGGTEWGHSAHGPGKSAVDLQVGGALDTFLNAKGTRVANWFSNCAYTLTYGSGKFCYESIGSTPHWHIQI